jgi:NTE family protein
MSNALRVLVLQGGGALGAYQAGVYEALSEAGVRPQWVAGISIGAINAAIIAGNPPETRLERLTDFWELVSSRAALPQPARGLGDGVHHLFSEANAAEIAAFGVPGFFHPRIPPAPFYPPGAPGALSFYDTAPLRRTLERLVDFDRINSGEMRLSVGAVNIRTGNFTYFDNTKRKIRPEHIMASGALPPGLPPVEIDGECYWDGGLVSNTPLQYVLDLQEEQDMRIHELRAAVRELMLMLPEERRSHPDLDRIGALAKEPAVTVVQLVYRRKPYEGASRDYEFSRQTMLEHWAAGVGDVRRGMAEHQRMEKARARGESSVIDPGWPPSEPHAVGRRE